MIEIGTTTPGTHIYERVSLFAQEVYMREHGADINPHPDVFAYATYNDNLVSSFGYYRARKEPLLFETYLSAGYERICGRTGQTRRLLAELGTKVVRLPHEVEKHRGDVSLAVTALLIKAAHARGIRYVGFTTNRLVKRITDTLGFDLIELGAPDLSGKSAEFQRNWETYFSIPQFCFGFEISSMHGCDRALALCAEKNILHAASEKRAA